MRLDLNSFLAADFAGRIQLVNEARGERLWSVQLAEVWHEVLAHLTAVHAGSTPKYLRLWRELMQLAPDSEAGQQAYLAWLGDAARATGLAAPSVVYLVISCEKYKAKALKLHASFGAQLSPAFIVLGDARLDEAVFEGAFLRVPAADNYESLLSKVLEALAAIRRAFGPVAVVKIDDDTMFKTPPQYERIAALAAGADYAGMFDKLVGADTLDRCWHVGKCEYQRDEPYLRRFQASWASGPLYFLGARAVEVLVREHLLFRGTFAGEIFEDKAVGDFLRAQKIMPSEAPLCEIFGFELEPNQFVQAPLHGTLEFYERAG
jgi:hypothetical protein